MKIINKAEIVDLLEQEKSLSGPLGFRHSNGLLKKGMNKKINEIAGFSEQILKMIRKFGKKKEIVFLECSCGKSYLSFVLSYIFERESNTIPYFFGVDTNRGLIQKCEETRDVMGYNNMVFNHGRTIDFSADRKIDMVIALHACNTATDEAIAKGIKVGAKYIMVVPCCQGQLRSQIKNHHPLTSVTQFGLLRSKFADILTDALRSQFLMGNGYYVELLEIVPPKLTPKNILISARKIKNTSKRNLEEYYQLNNIFKTNFSLQEYFCEQPLNDDRACAC
ncbi:SAM-dependent methyltransferase [Candidatus Scalindua japonica]|uniref:SAM-dependent methyltransferase n=1 Tax=Candidatus Scalindua japonica TaxID=1284222 RepID=A0A286U2J0_9BACT|nr:SAM-dependent methyltransferase [Candidatus Scalindua japonica]GAX62281.1 SAM-dependent methyltransferase [Candidatus Scalindua japonica]